MLRRPTLDEARSLLKRTGLTVADLDTALLECFLAIEDDGQVVAIAGAEVHDGVALLRSVATEPERRQQGRASEVVAAVEQLLREDGISDVYLLTESAVEYFLRRGYCEVSRDTAPVAIAATEQYRALCPDSATLMYKSLDD